jgi:hypothetical protein
LALRKMGRLRIEGVKRRAPPRCYEGAAEVMKAPSPQAEPRQILMKAPQRQPDAPMASLAGGDDEVVGAR